MHASPQAGVLHDDTQIPTTDGKPKKSGKLEKPKKDDDDEYEDNDDDDDDDDFDDGDDANRTEIALCAEQTKIQGYFCNPGKSTKIVEGK